MHVLPNSAAFPRAHRLLDPADYQRVFKGAKRSHDRLFTVLARKNDCNRPRLGLAVSVKTAGSAVKRNRIKRLIREYFRLHRQQLPSVDIVVIAKPGAVGQNRELIVSSLDSHWLFIRDQWPDQSSQQKQQPCAD